MTHTDQKPELLPCPFCGHRDDLLIRACDGTAARHIECDYCGASSGYSDRGDHVEEWNKRTFPPGPRYDVTKNYAQWMPPTLPDDHFDAVVKKVDVATGPIRLTTQRHDLARLVAAIKAAVHEHDGEISVTEAIGAIELAKLEILKEQE